MKTLLIAALAMLAIGCSQGLKVEVSNTSTEPRNQESVTVAWSEITAKLGEVNPQNVVIYDNNNQEQPSQVLFNGSLTPESLLFQVSIELSAKTTYQIRSGKRSDYTTKVFGRLAPERKDDFAWENDRIAHRVYGPALEATGEISNGIDIWLKRTDSLVIDKWYALNTNGQDYHVDRGEGLDCYKVGRTLGAGAMAPYLGDTLRLANNFTKATVLDSGPLRLSFRLEYAPFAADSLTLTENRTFTIDAASNFTKISEVYNGDFTSIPVAAGIVNHPLLEAEESGSDYLAIWEKNEGQAGYVGIAIIYPGMAKIDNRAGHRLAIGECQAGQPVDYYIGAGWDKWGFADSKAWFDAVKAQSLQIREPLQVKIIK